MGQCVSSSSTRLDLEREAEELYSSEQRAAAMNNTPAIRMDAV